MTENAATYGSEADLQAAVIEWLMRFGYLIIRVNSGRAGRVAFVRWYDRETGDGHAQTAGASDVLAIAPDGRMVAIECKHGDGKLTPDQAAFLHAVQRRGGQALEVRSLEDLEREL